jgi:flagellar basal body-associated protein FliL
MVQTTPHHCPRCNTPLAENQSICARCGFNLAGASQSGLNAPQEPYPGQLATQSPRSLQISQHPLPPAARQVSQHPLPPSMQRQLSQHPEQVQQQQPAQQAGGMQADELPTQAQPMVNPTSSSQPGQQFSATAQYPETMQSDELPTQAQPSVQSASSPRWENQQPARQAGEMQADELPTQAQPTVNPMPAAQSEQRQHSLHPETMQAGQAFSSPQWGQQQQHSLAAETMRPGGQQQHSLAAEMMRPGGQPTSSPQAGPQRPSLHPEMAQQTGRPPSSPQWGPQVSLHPEMMQAGLQSSLHPEMMQAGPQPSLHPEMMQAGPQPSLHPEMMQTGQQRPSLHPEAMQAGLQSSLHPEMMQTGRPPSSPQWGQQPSLHPETMPPAEQLASPLKKRSKMPALIAVMLLVLIVLGGGGYVGYTYFAHRPPTQTPITTTTIHSTAISYAGVAVTIQSVQRSQIFLDDPNVVNNSTDQTSTDVVRINLQAQNTTTTPVNMLYDKITRLVLPGGKIVNPTYVKAIPAITPGMTQPAKVDFVVPASSKTSQLVLRLGASNEAQLDIPLTTNADMSGYGPKTEQMSGQVAYQGLRWSLVNATTQLNIDGQQASSGMHFVTVTLKVNNTLQQPAITGSPFDYLRLKAGNVTASPLDSTLPVMFAKGETGKTGTVTFMVPQDATSLTLLFQQTGGFDAQTLTFQLS